MTVEHTIVCRSPALGPQIRLTSTLTPGLPASTTRPMLFSCETPFRRSLRAFQTQFVIEDRVFYAGVEFRSKLQLSMIFHILQFELGLGRYSVNGEFDGHFIVVDPNAIFSAE